MKRYAVVAWDDYYPNAALSNIRATFNKEENAIEMAKFLCDHKYYDRVEVYDLQEYTPDSGFRSKAQELMQKLQADD